MAVGTAVGTGTEPVAPELDGALAGILTRVSGVGTGVSVTKLGVGGGIAVTAFSGAGVAVPASGITRVGAGAEVGVANASSVAG